ncbi:hypothetical protein TeGR_g1773 [Tetraparma gracilis]|uniref:Major facilitator superfamily (MFS) profile domain-containing protein n=1 Tax=Tetraparma gracilis TaxID=2962635 RepID=A0ABQ6N7G0_9STRA|nr:hypothetical protein TeGR_g1773 [Tetraparma gracilis]
MPSLSSLSASLPSLRTLAALSGNMLEWYDFALFGSLSDVISANFFPEQGGHSALVETFVIFGLAFMARPLGGLLIGKLGDKVGRKVALETSIFLMAVPTFVMGCLPGYAQIGWWSVVLLTFTRLLQGMSVGGQLMTSAVFQIESEPDRSRWGEVGAWVMATANLGSLLGGVVSSILRNTLTEEQLSSWGWRVPFLSGILVGGSGIYLRKFEEEAEEEDGGGEGEAARREGEKADAPSPARVAFTKYRSEMLSIALVTGGWASAFYVGFIWMPIYMAALIEPPVPSAFAVSSTSMFFGVFVFFGAAGHLSDVYGRRPIMMAGSLGIALYSPIHLYLVSSTSSAVLSLFSNTLFGLILSCLGGPCNAFFVELVPREVRLTTLALGYNLAQPIAGGMSPAFATLLFDEGGPVMPCLVVVVFGMLSFVGVWIAEPSKEDVEKAKCLRGLRWGMVFGEVGREGGGRGLIEAGAKNSSAIEDNEL